MAQRPETCRGVGIVVSYRTGKRASANTQVTMAGALPIGGRSQKLRGIAVAQDVPPALLAALRKLVPKDDKPWRSGQKAPKLTVKFPPLARGIPLSQRQKLEVLLPPQHTASLNTLRGVRREMCRVYRGVANGRVSSDEATRRIYILKEIRAALEAEILTDVQQRLVLLSRDMDNNHNGPRVAHQPALAGG